MSYEQTTWVNGSTPALDATHLNNMEKGIANAVSKDGDTMKGALRLYGNPQTDYEAATKKYADENIKYISGTYSIAPGSTVVIGKIPDYSPTKHKVLVSTLRESLNDLYFPASFIELTKDGVSLDHRPRIQAYLDENGYISVKVSSSVLGDIQLSFIVIPVKTTSLIN